MQDACRVPECTRPIHLKRDRLCNAHYLQQRKGKPFTTPRDTTPHGSRGCYFEGCDKTHSALGLCTGHYAMLKSKGGLRPLHESIRPRGSTSKRDSQGRKECARCREWHAEESYGPSAKNVDGLRSECAACRRAHHSQNKEVHRARRTLAAFNITWEQRAQMLAEQGGRCMACRRPDPGPKGWCIDHDHACCPEGGRSCGECIRGILCSRCNLTLGLVGDDPELLQDMINYLQDATRTRASR